MTAGVPREGTAATRSGPRWPPARWRRAGLPLLLLGGALLLGGCQVPTFGAFRGATVQGKDEFKLWAGMRHRRPHRGGDRLGAHLLVGRPLPAPRRRRDPSPVPLEPAPRDHLHGPAGHHRRRSSSTSRSSPRTRSTPSRTTRPRSSTSSPTGGAGGSPTTTATAGPRASRPDAGGAQPPRPGGHLQAVPPDGAAGGRDGPDRAHVGRRHPRLLHAGLQLRPLRPAGGHQHVRLHHHDDRGLPGPVPAVLRPLPLRDDLQREGRVHRAVPAMAEPQQVEPGAVRSSS